MQKNFNVSSRSETEKTTILKTKQQQYVPNINSIPHEKTHPDKNTLVPPSRSTIRFVQENSELINAMGDVAATTADVADAILSEIGGAINTQTVAGDAAETVFQRKLRFQANRKG